MARTHPAYFVSHNYFKQVNMCMAKYKISMLSNSVKNHFCSEE